MTLLHVVQRRWKATHAFSLALITLHVMVVSETARNSFLQLPRDRAKRKLNVFGQDERQTVSDPQTFPYSAIGMLRWNDEVTCTATLIASDLIVTAAECVLDSNGKLLDTSKTPPTFSTPQTAETQQASITRVYKQSEFWTKWTQNSYVIVGLDVSLGMTTGALNLPTSHFFEDDVPMNVQLVDFGSKEEEAATCFQECKIFFPSKRDEPQYMVRHNCDVTAKRSPGAPMLIRSTNLDTYIIGIHSNAIDPNRSTDPSTKTFPSYNDSVANYGVLGSFIQPHFSFVVQQADPFSQIDPVNDNVLSRDSMSGSQRAETSVPAPHLDFTRATAYSCIGLVCAAWLAIFYAAARRICSNRRGSDEKWVQMSASLSNGFRGHLADVLKDLA